MTIVATRSGKVEGFERNGVHVFRGIPYATPPVGLRRWLHPEPEPAWDGVRDATKFSPQSAQSEFAMTAMLGGKRPPYSEDSLYLNVTTPACDDNRRPVMVWIHGGAFIWGAGDTPWYDGTPFALHGDVVVVTINYRLGPFGFVHFGDLFPGEFTGSGNAGLLDQIAALEWVRDSIEAFGGDPSNVTIFGESAGAASVATLLGTPAARGLFTKAIAQSGAASWIASAEAAEPIAAGIVERLGVRRGDADAMRAKSIDEVIAAMPSFRENGTAKLPFQPVIDGVTLSEPPLAAIAAGNAAGVHVITGTNEHEMTLFIVADPDYASLTDDLIRERITRAVSPEAVGVADEFRARYPDLAPPALWQELANETVFRMPATRLLEAQLGHGA
jgi:para-nitrobenzyl esterase